MKVSEVRLSPVHPTRKAVLTCEGMETCPYGIRMPDGWVVVWDYIVEYKPAEEAVRVEKPRSREATRKPSPKREATSARRSRPKRTTTQES